MPKKAGEKRKTMGQGGYIFCEQDSITKENSVFRAALRSLEQEMILKCNADWAPKMFNPAQPMGGDGYWGRTTILPALFQGSFNGTTATGARLTTWRSDYTTVGNQLIYAGATSGNTIAEDWKIALAGFAFPNKEQHILELRMQIGDRKYMRINLEEMLVYNKPAVIFTEGFIIDEEEAFDMYGYLAPPQSNTTMVASAMPIMTASDVNITADNYSTLNQRIVMLGFAAYKNIQKALAAPGSSTGV